MSTAGVPLATIAFSLAGDGKQKGLKDRIEVSLMDKFLREGERWA